MTAHDYTHSSDLPSELWFKIIAFVLSDSIYSLCCSTTEGADLSWDRDAFGTLRLVSKSFSHTAIKVADLACRPCMKVAPVSGEEAESAEDERGSEEDKLKLIYARFKLINGIRSNQDTCNFFSQSGVSLLSAYYGYIQLIKNCKAFFWRSVAFPVPTNGPSQSPYQQHLDIVEKIHLLFPTAFRNILIMLDAMAVPEMGEKLRRDVERDWTFFTSGLEIVYRCAQAVNRRDEWLNPEMSNDFTNYVNDLHALMKTSGDAYCSALKDRVPGEFPVITRLPGVKMAIELIGGNGHHHQALACMVNSWP